MRAQNRIVLPLLAILFASLLYSSSRAADWKEDRDRLRSVIENKVKLAVGRRLNPPAIAEGLGLSYPPPNPSRSMEEIKKTAAEATQNKVNVQYPPKQIEQFRQEAEEKYALWKKGDEVSFLIRGGRGRTPSVTGTLRHVSPTRVQVDNRWVARQDIDRKTLARLDPDIHESVVNAQVRKKSITRQIDRERLYDEAYPTLGKSLMEESHYVRWKGRWVAADELFEKALEYHRRKLAKEIRPDIEREVFTKNDYVQSDGQWVPKGLLARLKKALSSNDDEGEQGEQDALGKQHEKNDPNIPDEHRLPFPPDMVPPPFLQEPK